MLTEIMINTEAYYKNLHLQSGKSVFAAWVDIIIFKGDFEWHQCYSNNKEERKILGDQSYFPFSKIFPEVNRHQFEL